MNLVQALFGASGDTPRRLVDEPPARARWRRIRPKPNQSPVRACLAEKNINVRADTGKLRARAGLDYVLQYDVEDFAVVRGDIFEATYEPLGGGLYRKRSDVVLRYFTLDTPALVHTLEGPQAAEPGDWIVQGVAGELWPVPREKAAQKYDPA